MKTSKLISFSILLLVTTLACSTVTNFVATPTPVPVVLFELSDFTDTSCDVDSTTDVERFVENGQINLRVLTPQYVAWTECASDEYADFVVEADATQVGGPDANAYGLIFRYGLDADEFYAFLISGDGLYALTVDGAKRDEAEFLVDWTESPAINKGAQTNHIKVIAIGPSIMYYVNGQLLGETQDARYSAGTVGFFAGSLEDGGVQASFDNLKISEP
jgi:hypothetical protein